VSEAVRGLAEVAKAREEGMRCVHARSLARQVAKARTDDAAQGAPGSGPVATGAPSKLTQSLQEPG
jgi:hypothetical protein